MSLPTSRRASTQPSSMIAAIIIFISVISSGNFNSGGGGGSICRSGYRISSSRNWRILGAASFSSSSFTLQRPPHRHYYQRSHSFRGHVVIGQNIDTPVLDVRRLSAQNTDTDIITTSDEDVMNAIIYAADDYDDLLASSSSSSAVTTSNTASSTSSWDVADDWTKLSAADAIVASPSSSSWENSSGGIMLPRVTPERWQDRTSQDSDNDDSERMVDGDNHPSATIEGAEKFSTRADGNDASNDFADSAIETILTNAYFDDGENDVQLYDTTSTTTATLTTTSSKPVKLMDNNEEEIAYMIRCNATPKQLLISQGKALPELTDVMKYNPKFLLMEEDDVGDETEDMARSGDGVDDGGSLYLSKPLIPMATTYFSNAIETIFDAYAVHLNDDEVHSHAGEVTSVSSKIKSTKALDRAGIARWMTTCISSPFSTSTTLPPASTHKSSHATITIGPYDPSVSLLLSRYSNIHGSGRLTLSEFRTLYLEIAWVGYIRDVAQKKILVTKNASQYYRQITSSQASSSSSMIDGGGMGVIVTGKKNTEKLLKHASLPLVWRDLEAHGIFSPAEEERIQLLLEMERMMKDTLNNMPSQSSASFLMDECELLDDYEERLIRRREAMTTEDNDNDMLGSESAWNFLKDDGSNEDDGRPMRKREKSSHEVVEMASDGKTPLRIRDGQFVFIDEETCIGCSQVR